MDGGSHIKTTSDAIENMGRSDDNGPEHDVQVNINVGHVIGHEHDGHAHENFMEEMHG
jgi:hypothetical protein